MAAEVNSNSSHLVRVSAMALTFPCLLTAMLLSTTLGNPRDYVFLYLAIVAVAGLVSGLLPAIIAAAASFLLVDYFFVPPTHTLQFANSDDLISLTVFSAAAIIVGTAGSLRRNAQLRAERMSQELRDAYLELTRLAETEHQMQLLEETERFRTEVLTNVSHELRTPLASLLTLVTTTLRRPDVSPELQSQLNAMASAARRLNRLISDILDLNRIERGKVQLQPTELDIKEAAQAAAQRLGKINPSREVKVEVSAPVPEVLADWDRLGQILDNLLNNADRASPAGKAIRIAVKSTDAGMVAVHVIDEGTGVSEELRPHVFERYMRGDDQSGGLGLGLTIVKGLVEAHGGRAWLAEPNGGSGADFVFTLPTVNTEEFKS